MFRGHDHGHDRGDHDYGCDHDRDGDHGHDGDHGCHDDYQFS